jgi:flavodoxin
MKHTGQVFSLLLAFVMIFALAACGSGSKTNEEDPKAENKIDTASALPEEKASDSEIDTGKAAESAKGKALVVYFSRTGEQYVVGVIDKGNTAIVAEMIAEKIGADLWEVLPAEDYPMTYNELTDVAKKEQNENARPEYKGTAPDLSEYDTVFIGAPVWWGDWPMIMYTFFEQNRDSLADKTLIPFSTHEGSGLSGFDRKLGSAVPGATVKEGLAIRGSDTQDSQESVGENVADWLQDLGF